MGQHCRCLEFAFAVGEKLVFVGPAVCRTLIAIAAPIRQIEANSSIASKTVAHAPVPEILPVFYNGSQHIADAGFRRTSFPCGARSR